MSLFRSSAQESRSGSAAAEVAGERRVSVAHRTRSLESRISSLMAVGVMSLLGLGLLTWYYGTALTRGKHSAHAPAEVARVPAESPLPPLGRIAAPPLASPAIVATPSPHAATLTEPALLSRSSPSPPLVPLAPQIGANPAAGQPAPSPAALIQQRRLSGPPFARQAPAVADSSPALSSASTADASVAAQDSRATRPSEIGELLKPVATTVATARELPSERYLLPKGAFIDCTLETAIDSTLPGMTTCVTATDTFSVDGNVVLLERGSKLVGETRGQVQQGSARVFVLWTEVRTPTGVVVPLDSPGTDELGRSGMAGQVERHFWQRFGAALLISVIDTGLQSAARPSGGTLIYSPGASQDVLTEVLKGTIGIPPTVVKNQGDRIQVLVARDLDFRTVYELRALDEPR